jgi:1-aminocyclopropane-1-carboxylate deaminase/D-cysteine desulfhydrase-like pyridoxal-dependent ACC family enzyme
MLSMAYFAHVKKIPFTYITKPVPEWIGDMGGGNYHHAIRLGMQNIQVVHTEYGQTIQKLSQTYPGATVIDQGAANPFAETGIAMLARELNAFIKEHPISDAAILLPSGTGATSLYLSKHIDPAARVYTTPCVGDAVYLKAQWQRLEPDLSRYPTILTTHKKHHFAKPYPELLEMFKRLNETGIEFDMVYAPKTWLAFFENEKLFEGKTVIYVHTGGVIGNVTQRLRYEHKKMV